MSAAPVMGSLALAGARHAIDQIDDAMLWLIAARRRIVRVLAPIKQRSGLPARDPDRESAVRMRACRIARRLDVPDVTAHQLVAILIEDACRQQGLASDLDQGVRDIDAGMIVPAMTMPFESIESPAPHPLLRLLPPPRRVRPLLHAMPRRWQARVIEIALGHALARLMDSDALGFMRGRRLGIEVADLDVRWTFELKDRRLRACEDAPEATVRGSLADLLLLASRLEDADTLFFQRRLVLTGDTELGLTVRNVLDRLPWEEIPLSLRIALNRLAQFARAARAAHRGEGSHTA